MPGFYPAVGKHAVDAEVAGVVSHVIHPAVTEVGHHIGKVQARHGDLADAHFQKRAEGARKCPVCPASRSEAGRGREVAAFHDAAADKDLRMLPCGYGAGRMSPRDRCQTRARFRAACASGMPSRMLIDDFAEVITVLAHPRRSFKGQRALIRLGGLSTKSTACSYPRLALEGIQPLYPSSKLRGRGGCPPRL